mgnify:CR=1 FL=1
MSDLIKILLAIFLPPISVLIERGLGMQLLINIILTLIGVLPGSIHALYLVVSSRKERTITPPSTDE